MATAPPGEGAQQPTPTANPARRSKAAPVSITAMALVLIVGGFIALRPQGLTVEQILATPTQYEGQSVTLHGTVGEATALPKLGGVYKLTDRSGQAILVHSQSTPAAGSEQTVVGVLKVFKLPIGDPVVFIESTPPAK